MNQIQGSNWIRKASRLRLYARDSYQCVYCGIPVAPGDSTGAAPPGVALASLDHLAGREGPNPNATANLVTACHTCNATRGDTPAILFVSADRAEAILR